jgi:ATP-grasp domain-containing protein
MIFVIAPTANEDTNYLAKSAEAIGYNVIVPTSGWGLSKELRGKPGMVYGPKMFCEVIAEQMNWELLSTHPNWITTLPKNFVNREVYFTSVRNARKVASEKYFKLTDIQYFSPSVRASGKELPDHEIYNDSPILVSDVMRFTSEYRCVVKNRKAITACCYQKLQVSEDKNNYNFNHENIVRFINLLLEDGKVSCVPGFVIDIGKYGMDKFAIIDSKPAYSSRLFGCEPIAMLDAIKASVINAI